VASGLQYLHSRDPSVVHGNLLAVKTCFLQLTDCFIYKANILVDDTGEPRIAAVCFSRVADSQANVSKSTSFRGIGGHLRWQAPELLIPADSKEEVGNMTTKSDVYAFACVCLEIFTGEVPFSDLEDDAGVIMAITVKHQRPSRPSTPASAELDDTLWKIMMSCWATRPEDRPSTDELVECL
ncbi:kinase-like protein, partial [Rickenella mellea]